MKIEDMGTGDFSEPCDAKDLLIAELKLRLDYERELSEFLGDCCQLTASQRNVAEVDLLRAKKEYEAMVADFHKYRNEHESKKGTE